MFDPDGVRDGIGNSTARGGKRGAVVTRRGSWTSLGAGVGAGRAGAEQVAMFLCHCLVGPEPCRPGDDSRLAIPIGDRGQGVALRWSDATPRSAVTGASMSTRCSGMSRAPEKSAPCTRALGKRAALQAGGSEDGASQMGAIEQ